MLALLVALTLQEAKPLPPVAEPDWKAWPARVDGAIADAWRVLTAARPGRAYKDATERRDAERRVEAAYAVLARDRDGACAAAAAAVRSTDDDWARLMMASYAAEHGGAKGEALLAWALARAKEVDLAFDPVFEACRRMAARKDATLIAAVLAVLRTRDGSVAGSRFAVPEVIYAVVSPFGDGALPYLRAMVAHEDAIVRRNAAMALGMMHDDASRPLLAKMLAAGDVASGGAAVALAELGAAEHEKAIVELLSHSDARTRFWAAYALHDIGGPGAAATLRDLAREEEDPAARREMSVVAEALSKGRLPLPGGRAIAEKEVAAILDRVVRGAPVQPQDAASVSMSATKENLAGLERARAATAAGLTENHRLWARVAREVRKRLGVK